MIILNAEQARRLDMAAAQVGVPGLVLMENASRGAAEWIRQRCGSAPVVVVCGPGNNGGDGLAIGRHLKNAGLEARVLLCSDDLSPDARHQRRWCEKLGVDLQFLGEATMADHLPSERGAWVIDAMFGTGLSRPLESPYSELVEDLMRLRSTERIEAVVAIDLPSGLDADLAVPAGAHVVADATVTFAAEKPACVLSPNAEACGEVVVIDLGFDPHALLDEPLIARPRRSDIQALMPQRQRGGHKGSFGHLLVVGGSRQMPGAPALVGLGALRSGVGLVTLAAPQGVVERSTAHLPEALGLPLAADLEQNLANDAADQVLDRLEGYDGLALGPGLGDNELSRTAARRMVLSSDLPLVLDADGLNAFAGDLQALTARAAPSVLTPHAGEMARLLDQPVEEVVRDPIGAASAAAKRCGQVVVLKGAATVIAAPTQAPTVVREGNLGMATAGSGDVLTGVIGALLAGGLDAIAAATIGVWAHGRAGTCAAEMSSERGLVASDIADGLHRAWRLLEDA